MSHEVDYLYYDNVWQDAGTSFWTWGLGPHDGRYWSCAIIPEYANVAACAVTSFSFSSDDNGVLTGNFTVLVTAPAGSLLGFKAIRAPSV